MNLKQIIYKIIRHKWEDNDNKLSVDAQVNAWIREIEKLYQEQIDTIAGESIQEVIESLYEQN